MKIRLLKTGEVVDAIGPDLYGFFRYMDTEGRYFDVTDQIEAEKIEDDDFSLSNQKLNDSVSLLKPRRVILEF